MARIGGNSRRVPLVYAATSDASVSNTTNEISALSAARVGSTTVQPNALNMGTSIRVEGGGAYSSPSLTPGTVTVRVKMNGTVLASADTSLISSLLGGASNAGFETRVFIVCQSAGTNGSVRVAGGCNFTAPTGQRVFLDLVTVNPVTVDTTIAQTVDVTLQWSLASTTRSINVIHSQMIMQSN